MVKPGNWKVPSSCHSGPATQPLVAENSMPSSCASARAASTSPVFQGKAWNDQQMRGNSAPMRCLASFIRRMLCSTRASLPPTRYCSYAACVAPSIDTPKSESPEPISASALAASNGKLKLVLTSVEMPRWWARRTISGRCLFSSGSPQE